MNKSRARIIDGHADTFGKILETGIGFFEHTVLSPAYYHRPKSSKTKIHSRHIDYDSLLKSGVALQFMAIYTPAQYKSVAATSYALRMLGLIRRTLDDNKHRLGLITTRSDITALNKPSFIIGLESGSPLAGDLSRLRRFYELGIRCLTITHNPRNELGDGIGVKNPKGLSPFGKIVVRECEKTGIIIDVAHLAPRGIRDVVKLIHKPIIASHSGIKRLCDTSPRHPRNLDDDEIKMIARTGGVIGIFYIPYYLRKTNGRKDFVSVSDVVDHIAYVADKVGVDYVGLGSDFDGYDGVVHGLENVAQLPNLINELIHRGFNQSEMHKILFGNFRRVIRGVLSRS